jgi:hypothetical protein
VKNLLLRGEKEFAVGRKRISVKAARGEGRDAYRVWILPISHFEFVKRVVRRRM